MKMLLPALAAATVLAVLAGPAAAQNATAPRDDEKPVCRSQGARTGSILSRKRICHTRAEWQAIDVAAARDTQAALDARRSALPAR